MFDRRVWGGVLDSCNKTMGIASFWPHPQIQHPHTRIDLHTQKHLHPYNTHTNTHTSTFYTCIDYRHVHPPMRIHLHTVHFGFFSVTCGGCGHTVRESGRWLRSSGLSSKVCSKTFKTKLWQLARSPRSSTPSTNRCPLGGLLAQEPSKSLDGHVAFEAHQTGRLAARLPPRLLSAEPFPQETSSSTTASFMSP